LTTWPKQIIACLQILSMLSAEEVNGIKTST
jgi:hypothetical protein